MSFIGNVIGTGDSYCTPLEIEGNTFLSPDVERQGIRPHVSRLLLARLELTTNRRNVQSDKETIDSKSDQGKAWSARCFGYRHGQGADDGVPGPVEQFEIPLSTGRPADFQGRY